MSLENFNNMLDKRSRENSEMIKTLRISVDYLSEKKQDKSNFHD